MSQGRDKYHRTEEEKLAFHEGGGWNLPGVDPTTTKTRYAGQKHVALEIVDKNEGEKKDKKRRADGKALREEKRRKFLAKQERKRQAQSLEDERVEWFRSKQHFATHISLEDLNNADLDSILQPYRNLQQQNEQSSSEQYFIAEGTETVRLLIQNSSASSSKSRRIPPITLQSVFVKTTAFFEDPVKLLKAVEEAAAQSTTQQKDNADPPFRVLVGTEEVQSKVVGFPFCRGALACGKIPSWAQDEEWLVDYLKSHPRFQTDNQQPLRLVALDGVCDTANLGSVVRCASAFGLDALILSHDSCDVWYRKAVRVSMGHVSRIPCIRVSSLAQTIRRLQQELGVVSFGAVIDKDADCVLEQMKTGDVTGAWCCVVGNEGNGISAEVSSVCSKRIRIDMEDGVDSLSAPVAAGILLHGLKEREG